jgi:hypothetical protein
MRPLSFRSDALRTLLLRRKIATLDELKQALGAEVDVTVFRKLKPLDYLTSYSHRGRYYTLREIARFDDHGLWSQAGVRFSRFGTLLATAEEFIHSSPRGYCADELAPVLHVAVQDVLHQLARQERVSRQVVSGKCLARSSISNRPASSPRRRGGRREELCTLCSRLPLPSSGGRAAARGDPRPTLSFPGNPQQGAEKAERNSALSASLRFKEPDTFVQIFVQSDG